MPEVVVRKGVRTTAPTSAAYRWVRAGRCVVLKLALMISFASFFLTGIPVEMIIDQQNASSGMYASGEGLEVIYLVTILRSTIRNKTLLFWLSPDEP
jgi:hypothetical protein